MHKVRKTISDNPMRVATAILLVGALLEYVLHEPGFAISVKPGRGAAKRKRQETVSDEVFGLDLAGEARENGSNDDGYWYRFKSGLQVSRSHVVSHRQGRSRRRGLLPGTWRVW